MLRGREQQHLAVGRALLSNPNLLLLDEPTEGIRPSIVDPIEDVIIGFKNSRGVRYPPGRTRARCCCATGGEVCRDGRVERIGI